MRSPFLGLLLLILPAVSTAQAEDIIYRDCMVSSDQQLLLCGSLKSRANEALFDEGVIPPPKSTCGCTMRPTRVPLFGTPIGVVRGTVDCRTKDKPKPGDSRASSFVDTLVNSSVAL